MADPVVAKKRGMISSTTIPILMIINTDWVLALMRSPSMLTI